MTRRCDGNARQTDLVLALESARTRLAVAVATGRRSTPPAVMQGYLDTAERLGRVLRKVRNSREDPTMSSCRRARALESLEGIAACDDPAQMSRILGDIIAELERCIAFPGGLPL